MVEATFGCTLSTSGSGADPLALRDVAQAAEALGYDCVWVSDHVVIPAEIASAYPYSEDGAFRLGPLDPYLEPLAVLTYLAGCTQRIRLGTHVLILPYRHPLLIAKMVATLDVLSAGRVDLGVGVGWMREEFEALGQDTFDRRGAVTDEQIRILRKAWTEDVPSFDGHFYRFSPLGAHPHPVQRPHPPIWIGGHSGAAIRRAARFGDGWLPIGARPPADLSPAELAASITTLYKEARRAGRDPATIRIGFSTGVTLRQTSGRFGAPGEPDPLGRRRLFDGTTDVIADDFRRYRALGVNRFVVGFGSTSVQQQVSHLRHFAEHIWPASWDV